MYTKMRKKVADAYRTRIRQGWSGKRAMLNVRKRFNWISESTVYRCLRLK